MGREDDLTNLHEQLQQQQTVAISAIAGMGGIGKTELALQYALKYCPDESYPGGICWLRAREEVGTQIVSFARSCLDLIPPDDLELAEKVRWCWRRWREGTALLIFDDVQNYEDVRSFLPPQDSRFKVLITTRSRFGSPVQNYEIKVLSEAAALELLRRLVPDGRIDQNLETAKQICDWLGYLPLGLELVGRYLVRKKGTLIAKLWERLQGQKLAARALLEAEPGMTASLGVTAAFELSWQELNEDAQRLAALLSLFALAEIPWELVQQCLPEMDEEDLEDLRDEQLVNLSLLSFEREEIYQLHQLLREFFAVKRSQVLDLEAAQQSLCSVLSAKAAEAINQPKQSLLKETDAIIPHLKEAVEQFEMMNNSGFLQDCHGRLALLYKSQGRHNEAEPLLVQSLVICKQQLEVYHPYVATCLNRLGSLYESQGRYNEAEPLLVQSLQIYEQELGKAHCYVATALINLAALHHVQGRYNEAEPLLVRSLEIYQQQLGTDHPYVAISLGHLAQAYRARGRYSEAEPLLVRALEIYEQQLGADHSHIATSLNRLAGLYVAQGRYSEAEPLYEQALRIYERQLGEDHPDVATNLRDQACLYRLQKRYGEAEPLHLRALDIRQRKLGEDHPHVADSLNDLALLYEAQKRYGEAEPLSTQSLRIRQRKLGKDHPAVAGSFNNLALLYEAQGYYEKSEQFYINALSIFKEQLGVSHPEVANSLNNLAYLHGLQKHYNKAECLYLQAIAIWSEKLGQNHPQTQGAQQNFLCLLRKVLQEHRTDELSEHPMTRSLLQELQNSSD